MSIRDRLAASLEEIVDETPNEGYYDNLMEVEETAGELEESLKVVDGLGEVAQSMESICTALESHIADGGMSAQTAISHNVAMGNVCRRLGLPIDGQRVSVESMASDEDRLAVSQEALEGAKALLKRIWEGIKKAWDTAIAYLKKFWEKVRNAWGSIRGKAKSIKTEAKATDSSAVPPEVDYTPVMNVPVLEEKDAAEPNGKDALKPILALLARANVVREEVSEARKAMEELGAAAAAGDMEKFDQLMTEGTPAKVKEKKKNSTQPRYSNKYRKAKKDNSGIVNVEVKKKGMTAAEVVTAVEKVEKLADEVAKIESIEVKQVVASSEKLVKNIESTIAKIENDPIKVKQFTSAASEVRSLASAISASSTDYVRACLQTSAAIISVSERSLKKAA